MSNWLDDILNQASADGLFDNLPGAGKPLNLDMSQNLAHRILRQNNETLPWIGERQLVLVEIDRARESLSRAWVWYCKQSPTPTAEHAWQRALDQFKQAIIAINHRIRDFNLQAPLPTTHMAFLDADHEIERIKQIV